MNNKPIFLIKQSIEPDALDLYIYDHVEGDSHDWWSGETIESKTSANYIQKQLESANNIKQINVFINSYGGEVKEGLAIYNQLKRHEAQVNVYVDGFACSIASVIAMAGDKIIMGTNTLMMIHHASMGAWGNAEELRKAANDLDAINKSSCSTYLLKAGDKLSEEKLYQLLDQQTWLSAEQCLELGLCDEVAGLENDSISKAQQRFNNMIQQQLKDIKPQQEVPEKFEEVKNNAFKLRQKFIKKLGGIKDEK